jgi:hypothetical protein
MPKALPPVSLCPGQPELFRLPDADRRKIAAALGLQALTPALLSTLESSISRFKFQSPLPRVTAGQSVAAIDAALAVLEAADDALLPFTDLSISGIGGPTAKTARLAGC